MTIAIIMEYAHNKVGVKTMEITEQNLPLDVAPNMVCNNLISMPTGPVFLGKSISHHFPSDVIALPITKVQKRAIESVYNTPVKELEPGESEEYYFEYESEIRAESAIALAKSYI